MEPRLIDNFVFSLKDRGIKKLFVTNASNTIVSNLFFECSSTSDLITRLKAEGYVISDIAIPVAFDYDAIR